MFPNQGQGARSRQKCWAEKQVIHDDILQLYALISWITSMLLKISPVIFPVISQWRSTFWVSLYFEILPLRWQCATVHIQLSKRRRKYAESSVGSCTTAVCAIVHMVMSPMARSWLQQEQIGRGWSRGGSPSPHMVHCNLTAQGLRAEWYLMASSYVAFWWNA